MIEANLCISRPKQLTVLHTLGSLVENCYLFTFQSAKCRLHASSGIIAGIGLAWLVQGSRIMREALDVN
jgi:hypothetical protein